MKSILRIAVLTAVLALTSLAPGHAVSDTGTCRIYCYDIFGNQTAYYQTQNDFDGCCSDVADMCPADGRGYFSAQYYFFQGVC